MRNESGFIHRNSILKGSVLFTMVATLLFFSQVTKADVVAFDMVGSASQNLISYTNTWTGAFGSAADGFQKYQRSVSPSIPYSILDDSLSIYTGDNLGIIKEGNTDEFFGATDTVNGDNSAPVTATWVFDVSGASGLGLSIDMGAMGDFESSDTFVWSYSIDGGPFETAFENTVDEAGSNTYTLEGGASFTLSDPTLVEGVMLTNDLATFSTELNGTGSTLTVTLTLSANGGSEAFAFQNLKVTAGNLPPPGPLELKISEIQGSGLSSPVDGQKVAIEAIVVGDFQDGASGANGDLNGFYVQEEDADADADSATSEGIFVYDGSPPAVNVQIGDLVRVEGVVSEYNGLTEITSLTSVVVLSSGNSLPTASVLSLPVSNIDNFEAYEGMYVTFPQDLVISEYSNFDRFNVLILTSERHLTPTAEFEPGLDAIAAAESFVLDTITLDDGRTSQNSDPAIHPNGFNFDLTNLFRGGDTLANVTGVMDYSFGRYRIQPTQGADYTIVNPSTTEPDDVGGNLRVASFNVLNYFNGDGLGGGFPTSRGADDLDEFTRQRDKVIAAMVAIDADVFGLMEIENDGYGGTSAIQDLVDGLNDATAPDTFAFVDPGVPVIGTDEIAVGLIYNQTEVAPQGSSAILDSSVDPLFLDTKNRPVLAQTFVHNLTDDVLTVAVNHLKSKGSSCDDVGDPDIGDGAGNCNLTRTDAAAALADWLAGDPTGSGDSDFLIIGDLNSYDKEDPIDVLIDAGYTDLAFIFGGEEAYSYVFDGQMGYLDYALASPSLFEQIKGTTQWHINADEPDLIDYDTSFKQPAQDAIYAPDAYRSSDHDPVIVGIEMHFDFTGFFRPIDNLPEMNKVKAGLSVPVKFSLNGDYGLDVLADGYPMSQEIDCDSGSPQGESVETATPGGSSLSYDPDIDQYNYVWKTSTSWTGSCRQLTVQLIDGSSHHANFKFR